MYWGGRLAAPDVAAQGAQPEEHHAPSQRVACSLRCSQRRVWNNWGKGDCDVVYTLNAEARTTKFSFEALVLVWNSCAQCGKGRFLLVYLLGAVIHRVQIYIIPTDGRINSGGLHMRSGLNPRVHCAAYRRLCSWMQHWGVSLCSNFRLVWNKFFTQIKTVHISKLRSLTSAAELFSSLIAVREKLCRPTSTSPATTWLFSSQRLIPSSTKRGNLTERLTFFLA